MIHDDTHPTPQARTSPFEQALLGDPAQWKPWLMSSLVDRIQDVFPCRKSELQRLYALLHEAQDQALRAVPVELRQALLSNNGEANQVLLAYRLGQLEFAQQLVGTVARRRVDDDFEEVLTSEHHRAIVSQLRPDHAEISAQTLADGAQLTLAATKTRLGQLQSKGICDTRSNGNEWVHFLTPAARAVLGRQAR